MFDGRGYMQNKNTHIAKGEPYKKKEKKKKWRWFFVLRYDISNHSAKEKKKKEYKPMSRDELENTYAD